jgi:hypothetical protein
MNVKRETFGSNEKSNRIAHLYRLVTIAEDYYEEYGIEVTTDLNNLYSKDEVTPLHYSEIKLGVGPYNYKILYREVYRLFVELVKEMMIEYSNLTNITNIEYLLILLNDGNFIILEGDENKIEVPFPSGVASLHTHPDLCIFSRKDLETISQLFSIGYLVSGVITTECGMFLYREGVFTIDDKINLTKIIKMLKKTRKFEEILDYYKLLNTSNLKLSILKFL